VPLSKTLATNFDLSCRLSEWREAVPLELRPGNAFEKQHNKQPPLDIRRLRTALSFRYFGACVLAHRPLLLKFLDFEADSDGEQNLLLLNGMGALSLKACLDACGDIVLLGRNVMKESSSATNLLGAWWYTTYYSKSYRSSTSVAPLT
jgi:hypothetical protein